MGFCNCHACTCPGCRECDGPDEATLELMDLEDAHDNYLAGLAHPEPQN